mgnify:CR=1 FL=1
MNYESNTWEVGDTSIYLAQGEYFRFAKYDTREEAIKQLGFMVEGAIKGCVTYEFK